MSSVVPPQRAGHAGLTDDALRHDRMNALWDEAVIRYEREHGGQLDISAVFNRVQQCRSPEEITELVDQRIGELGDFRSQGEGVKRFLNGVVKVLLSFSDASADLVAGALPGGKFIVGAFTGLLKATEGVSALYDAMRDALDNIRDALERFRSHIRPSIPISTELSYHLVGTLTVTLEILTLLTRNSRTAVHAQKRWWRRALVNMRIRAVDFAKILVGDEEFKDKLRELNRWTKAEALQLAAEMHADVAEIHQQVIAQASAEGLSISYHRIAISKLISPDHSEQRQVRRWLDPAEFEHAHYEHLAQREEFTCDWVFEDEDYRAWKDQTNGAYAIIGHSGTGKSVLCSHIVEQLRTDTSASPDIAIAFFHFDATSPTGLRNVLASLLIQLAHQPGVSQAYLHEQFHARDSEHPRLETLSAMLREIVGQTETTFLLIDALDQCGTRDSDHREEQRKLLKFLISLHELELPGLRLLVTSRPEAQIMSELGPFRSNAARPLQKHKGHLSDIETHVAARLAKPPFSRWATEMAARAAKALTDETKSQGMFLWVRLQLRLLERCAPRDLDATIASLPIGLEATYRGILERFHAHASCVTATRASSILGLIAVVKRPLTISEALAAFAYDAEQGAFASEIRAPHHSPESSILENLPIIVDIHTTEPQQFKPASAAGENSESAGSERHPSTHSTLRFIHFSVKEYLTSAALREDTTFLHLYAVDPLVAEMHTATLSVSSLTESASMDFASYAKEHWFQHVAPGFTDYNGGLSRRPIVAQTQAAALLSRALTLFLDCSVEYWADALYTPLHWAARYGLVEDTTRLLGHYKVDVAAKSERFHERYTPLTWTVVHATHPIQLKTIDILLTHIGNVEQQTEYIRKSLLQLALDAPNSSLIVEHLVSRGTDVQTQDDLGRTTLLYAVWRAESWETMEPVVRLLTQKGVDPNFFPDSPTYWGKTPLWLAAVVKRAPRIVKALLACNARSDHHHPHDLSVLHWCVALNLSDSVKLLRQYGADTAAVDDIATLDIEGLRKKFGRTDERFVTDLLENLEDERESRARKELPDLTFREAKEWLHSLPEADISKRR